MKRMISVVISPEVAREMGRLPLTIRLRVSAIAARLADWPNVSGAKPLRGNLAGRYRIRTGDYRVQFFIVGQELIIEKVGHRDGFYDER